MREVRSTCPYCGVGCGVIVESDGTRITGVRGDPEHPANCGRLCTKGSTLHLVSAQHVARQVRLLQPMRRAARGEAPHPVHWDTALDLAADRIGATVQAHGPDALGLYVSGQLLTEDYFVFNKLARALLGTNQIDSNSRLCMSSAVTGYKATLGADAPPACYDDLALAHTVFIAGSNTAWAHPILMRRLEDAKRANPAQRWIVVDPRRTETAALADLHLPLLPGTDVALFHGMLHVMLWEGLVDAGFIARHTMGFDALRAAVREFTPRHAAQVCGLNEEDIVQAARCFAGVMADGSRAPTLSLYCQGLNQSSSGSDKNAALINLHLACGQIGRPGAGPLSLTGQPNAMGGREVGAMATLLPGHRDFGSAADRAEVAARWGIDGLPASPGRTAVEMFEAAADGEVKLLWIACTNPAQSLPDQALVRRALQRAEFVIVQEAYATAATCDFADLLLPAAAWGEKDGTMTNSERRISRVRAVLPPAGESRPDWIIARDVARRIEARLAPDRPTLFPFETPEQAWNEHRELTRGRDLDITGLGWAMLDQGPQQWPLPEGQTRGRARLYEDHRFATADGRARFAAPPYRPVAEPRDARFAFSLTTGRLRDQWHGMTRSGTLGRLFAHDREPAVELHPQDLDRHGFAAGTLVRLRSRHGECVLPVRASDALRPAQAFVAMHWGDAFVGGQARDGSALAGVNALLARARCPQSMQPELKHVPVRIERADLPWTLHAAGWLADDQLLQVRESLRRLFHRFGYASCIPIGREPDGHVGLRLHAAAAAPVAAGLVETVARAFGLDGDEALRFTDPRRGRLRLLRLAPASATATLDAFLLAGDGGDDAALLALLEAGAPAAADARDLLLGCTLPARAARAAQVCNCLDVDEPAIVTVLADCRGDDAARLHALQQRLRCGTQCGSCLPALRALVRRHPAAAEEQAA